MTRYESGELAAQVQEIEKIGRYLNRLSDLLFTISRFINVQQGTLDVPYSARKPEKI